MSDYAIDANGLTKRYDDKQAVDDLSFSIPDGTIYGFLGPNGAGKTTTMRMLVALTEPTACSAEVAGVPVTNRAQLTEHIGYLSADPPVFDELTGWEQLRHIARLHGVPDDQADERIKTLLDRFDLRSDADRRISSYLTGMRNKVGIIGTLFHHPDVVLLDEPTAGLDPRVARTVRDTIADLVTQEMTVLLSTHILPVVDELADTIGVTACDIEYYHRDIERVAVTTETTSPQDNRLDIVIRAPDAWFVCIECKVDASEGRRQTQRYVEDTHIGSERKETYPEDGHHYLFLSKQYTADSAAEGFEDIYWQDVVEAFQNRLQFSRGQYPQRSVSQLDDFLSTIISVTNMADDDFEQTQQEKVRLLGEYRDDIDELLDAAESLRQRTVEEWPELFRAHVGDNVWTDEWTMRDQPREYGCLFRHGWYLDDENLEPTNVAEETHGSTGFRLHFNHLIRREESFSRGELTYRLRSPTRVPLRDAFHEAYNSDRWQEKLDPLLDDLGIENIGNKQNYMRKTYDVDQSGLPESYFDTLATAFEEHLKVAEVINDILDEAVDNIEQR